MINNKNRGSIYSIIVAGLLTSVILLTIKLKANVLLAALGYYLLPYLIMYLAFRRTKKDMYWPCDLGALIFSIVGGLALLIAVAFAPDPFGLLFIPTVQLVTFVVLHGGIMILRIFAKDMKSAEKERKGEQ